MLTFSYRAQTFLSANTATGSHLYDRLAFIFSWIIFQHRHSNY